MVALIKTVSVSLPQDAVDVLAKSGGVLDLADESRVAAAIEWYRERRLSMERAAGIAGLAIRDFLDELVRRRVSVINFDEADLAHELSANG